jgi:UDP-N-acetylglucosamine 2-epimerase (non-hydrolysing)
MKVLTVLGTRPEIIRLSLIIPKLDQLCEHVVVHTGQNFAESLSDVFFRELRVRPPDRHLGIRAATFGEQAGRILSAMETVLGEVAPDRVLILGDTNSGLAAVVAKRRGIPVYHMEAGNRCFDDRVPEEVNRRIIDHCSDVLMPYTERSRANLLREGIHSARIHVTGNPIMDVLREHAASIEASPAGARLGVQADSYFLVTLHRSENVDDPARLRSFLDGLERVHREHGLPVICSTHPRTRDVMTRHRIPVPDPAIRLVEPLGFFDFVSLEKHARCVLSDSGTVQEECCVFNIPNVTLRDVTERPETVEVGSNILSGSVPEAIARAVRVALARGGAWNPPPEYTVPHVADTVAKIVLGYRHPVGT